MIDEDVAKQAARGGRRGKPLRRLKERARKRTFGGWLMS